LELAPKLMLINKYKIRTVPQLKKFEEAHINVVNVIEDLSNKCEKRILGSIVWELISLDDEMDFLDPNIFISLGITIY